MAIDLNQFKLTPEQQAEKLETISPEEPKRLSFLQRRVEDVGKTISNIPSSGARFVGDIAQAVSHPVETITGLGQLGAGAIQSIPGVESLFTKRAEQTGKTALLEANRQAFQNVKNFFADRYGGLSNIRKTIIEDPVGIAVDLSTILSGGAGLAIKAPRFAGVSKVISTAGKATEPITATTKAITTVGKIPKKIFSTIGAETLGVTTGAGGEAIRTAYRSAKAGSKEFSQALRGKIPQEDVLTYAKEGLNKLKQERSAEYVKKLGSLKETTNIFDLAPVKNKINELLNKYSISGQKKKGAFELDFSKSPIADTTEQIRIGKLIEEALNWSDNTVIGLDTLKRRLADFTTTSREGLALKTSLKNFVRDYVAKSNPEYGNMVSGYERASTLIDELESVLSLKQGATIDSALTKLSSAIKRDHTFRRDLLQKLDEATKQDVAGQVAGALLNPVVPSGLIGRSIFGGGPVAAILTGTLSPNLFSSLLFASPRVVGEFLNALGVSAKHASNIIEFLNRIKAGDISRTTIKSLFQSGRLRRISE